MKRIIFYVLPAMALLSLISFKVLTGDSAMPIADKIFINGRILTIDAGNSIAQAVAIKNGKILAVGYTKEVLKYKGKATIMRDLNGKTLMPGIIDGHSHFAAFDLFKMADVSPPPVGRIKKIADIITALQAYKTKNNIKDGEWISAFGYDPDQLLEKRHPTKEDLDAAFPNNPVVITHTSGHMVVANSAALKASGIDAATKNPAGGMIVRKPGSNEPTGLLQESAAGLLKITASGPPPTLSDQLQLLKKQEAFYASMGITTAQEGLTSQPALTLLKAAAADKELYIDIDALPFYSTIDPLIKDNVKFGVYDNHLKLAGFKLIADGSPQGKTAYFTKPYLTPVPGCDGDDCRGIPVITQQQFNDAVIKGFKNNIRVFVHCNGDATIDMYIKAVENANKVLNTTSVNRRPVIIHSQFVRADQLDKYKELNMLPSFFTNHAFFYGDTHINNLGMKRAFFLSPTKTALTKGVIFTNHTDYPVTPLNQMFLLWTSVARQSRLGVVVGPDERLTPMEGLRAITINGAYEYMEEKTKGSIEKGKLADMVILSADPTKVEQSKIKDIVALETIKEGKTIYKR